MPIRKTVIEETPTTETLDPRVIQTTKTVVDPDLHTQVVENSHVVDDASTVVRKTKVIHEPLVRTEHPQHIYETKKTIFRTYQIIWYVLMFIEVLLVFRLILKAIGASPFSGFVNLIYAITAPLALPFAGIVQPSVYGSSVIEWSTIFAAVVYFVIAWGLIHLFEMFKPVTPEEVESNVDTT